MADRNTRDTQNTPDSEKVHEAYQKLGHLGGEATSETHGPEFYEEIGQKGGEATSETHGREFYQEIGHKGGEIGGHKGGEARKEQMARGEIFSDDNPNTSSER